MYWDVNGDQALQSTRQAAVRVHVPNDLQQTKTPVCYAGSYGHTARECTISTSDGTIESATTQALQPRQTLTYVASFQKGYFQPSKWYETIGEYWKQIVATLLPILVLGGGSAIYWWRKGRDAKGSGIIIPQYDAPDHMKPLGVGALIDFKVDNHDMTATIIDLAVHGYLKIIETKEDKLIGKDKLTYRLQLRKSDFSGLDANEALLLKTLFTKPEVGAETYLAANKNTLYKVAATIKKNVKSELQDAGYFRRNVRGKELVRHTFLRLLFVAFIVATGCILLALAKPSFFVGCTIGGLVAVPFLLALDARTAKGVAAKEHIQGLKLYLEVAEKDRLKKLQAPNAPYAANAHEPVKTVDLFEKLLPYAMVLGVEKQWAGQFESLYTSPPDWYNGNWTTFNAFYLASSLSGGMDSAVNGAFSAPSSSGSSGFGGGGFSGGGGGGGGVGGW